MTKCRKLLTGVRFIFRTDSVVQKLSKGTYTYESGFSCGCNSTPARNMNKAQCIFKYDLNFISVEKIHFNKLAGMPVKGRMPLIIQQQNIVDVQCFFFREARVHWERERVVYIYIFNFAYQKYMHKYFKSKYSQYSMYLARQ